MATKRKTKEAKVRSTGKSGSQGKSAEGKDAKRKGRDAAVPDPKRLKKALKDASERKVKRPKVVEARKEAADLLVETTSFCDALRVGDDFDLAALDPRATPAFPGKKAQGKALMNQLAVRMGELQERLYAESREDGTRSVLLVVQGMDTAGKGGIMRHVVGTVDPQGVTIKAFKAPTAEELEHSFLWRIRQSLPGPGEIGVFDRSHYEDVLIARVHDLVPARTWRLRYNTINRFESGLVNHGTTVVKVVLHISNGEQRERLAERLDRPDKHWKYNPGDVTEREYWDAYQEAYQAMLDRCSTAAAPWYVVPADRKWYARLAVMNLLIEHLDEMDPTWPKADFDVDAERQRLARS